MCVEPAEAGERVRVWLGSAWPVLPQQGDTLGERLTNATNKAFTKGAHRVAVIGTDSPWLDSTLIEEAFSAMERADLVLGPAADGGYYLLGLAKPIPGPFLSGIAWSTSQVLNQTLVVAHRLGMSASLLRLGYDIDHLEDLHRWMEEDPCHGVTVPIPAGDAAKPTVRR